MATGLLLALSFNGRAQTDTISLTTAQAERMFLERNLSLVSARYDIDINQALAQQAHYWDNPNLYISTNVYDGKFFRHTYENGQYYGQWYAQVQQQVRTAGKRSKLIALADDATLTSTQQFTRQMQSLRYLLTTDLNNLRQLQESERVYATQKDALQNMVKAMDAQLAEGNISRKDNVRVKALLFGLQSDAADLRKQEADLQADLKVLLQLGGDTAIRATVEGPDPPAMAPPKLGDLLDSATKNRPDLWLARTNLQAQGHNLAYQKSMAVPDLNLDMEYDQNTSYVRHYVGMGVGIPIPVFNRNKGNIRAAEVGKKQAQVGLDLAQSQATQDVVAAYRKWKVSAETMQQFRGQLGEDYEQLVMNMLASYRARQVSLIEFTDFFQAYTDTRLKQLSQEASLRNAAAEIELTTGTNVFNPK